MRTNKVSATDIKKFWNWFVQNCQNFGDNFENNTLIDELDRWVKRLGNFSWEIGPGIKKENLFVISPNGNLQLLPETKNIIDNSRKCDGWEYYYAKPAKNWNPIFEYENSDGENVRIDASSWKYILLKYNDGMFTVIIQAPQLNQMQDDDKLMVAEILLDGILGEEIRMLKISNIEIVNDFDLQYKGKESEIVNLGDHINKMIRDN